MNTHIFKYPIKSGSLFVPKNAEFLSVQMQRNEITSWWMVDPEALPEEILISVVGTGHPIRDEGRFLGTVQDGSFVWHIFMLYDYSMRTSRFQIG